MGLNHEILSSICPVLREFLVYCETIKGKSSKTVEQYYIDITLLVKFLKMHRGLTDSSIPFSDISTNDVDDNFFTNVTLSELYSFLVYCKNERDNGSAARARKTSSIKSFFKYLCDITHKIPVNPAAELNAPKLKKSLPVHLSLEQSIDLLKSVDGPFKERDYCILTLFLNCGMRLSELCSLNYTDIKPDRSLKILGKGNKERVIYLNDACIDAIANYMKVRPVDGVLAKDKNALFLSKRRQRISNKTVQYIVYTNLERAGLDGQGYSAHKLRHTAATLMYQQGGVDIRILKDILGHESLGTTQIYTHVANKQVEQAINSNPLANIKTNAKENETTD